MKTLNFIIFCCLLCLIQACENRVSDSKLKKIQLSGETMGTQFNVSYFDSTDQDLSGTLNELLLEINNEVSTYIPSSTISRFNEKHAVWTHKNSHFSRNLLLSKEIYLMSSGYFNPCVMPLVNYWGFGFKGKDMVLDPDSLRVQQLVKLTNFDSLRIQYFGDSILVEKRQDEMALDFSAIAKGDAVDQVAKALEERDIFNYYVEIGGEIRCGGRTSNAQQWRTGIRKPVENGQKVLATRIEMENESIATSGNYENYHEDQESGKKYAHTINPFSGYPEKNDLLSASVVAKDCAIADAYATAFMAMGFQKSKALSDSLQLEVFFIYSDDSGALQHYFSESFQARLK